MADTILTESEASLAVEGLGWRSLLDCLTTAVTVGSLFDACEVIRAAVDIAGPLAHDHLRLRATADRVVTAWLAATVMENCIKPNPTHQPVHQRAINSILPYGPG